MHFFPLSLKMTHLPHHDIGGIKVALHISNFKQSSKQIAVSVALGYVVNWPACILCSHNLWQIVEFNKTFAASKYIAGRLNYQLTKSTSGNTFQFLKCKKSKDISFFAFGPLNNQQFCI